MAHLKKSPLEAGILAVVMWIGVYLSWHFLVSSSSPATPPPAISTGQTNSLSAEAIENSNSMNARVCAEIQIRDMLKSPSTASFSWTPDISKWGKNYAVISYVDAENSFGANIRQHWQCRVTLAEKVEDCVATCTFSSQ